MVQQPVGIDIPPNEKIPVTAEVGKVGLRRFGGYLSEEFDPNLRGPRGMRRFDEMRRNDYDVGGVLTAIEMSMLSVEWMVEAGGESAEDEEAKEFLEQCMDDMSMSWRDFLSDVFTMFPFGFHLAEIVYKQRTGPKPKNNNPNAPAPSKYDDGRIGWRKIAPRHQETIEKWDFDDAGGLRGAWQQLPEGGRVYLPIDKCILFTTKRERGNPEGMSILRNAWMAYYIKTNIEEIEVISAERDMTGIPFIRLPMGATEDDKNAAVEILEKIKWDDQAGIVLPTIGEGEHMRWEFGTVSSPGSPRIDTNVVVQRNSIAIARSVLAQFLTLGSGEVGSFALSKDHHDLFQMAIKGWLDRIEETINRFLVARLFALNDFQGLEKLPRIIHGRLGQRAVDTFVAALSQLATMGMPFVTSDWNFIRSELEMPEIPEEELEEIEAQKEEMAQLMQRSLQKKPEPEKENVAPTKQPEEDEEPSQTTSEDERWYSRKY